jgi:hypothetical protein
MERPTMSESLSIELPDEISDAIQATARKTGQPPQQLALEWLTRQAPRARPKLPPAELEAARQRLRRHFGAVKSGNPQSADNDQIDADLVREYENPHEGAS